MFQWTSFGKVKFKDVVYDHDVYVDLDMNIHKRLNIPYEKFDTGHKICREELEAIVPEEAKAVVIGTGQSGCADMTEDANKFIEERKLELHVLNSPEAIKKYNELCIEKKTVALIHVTC